MPNPEGINQYTKGGGPSPAVATARANAMTAALKAKGGGQLSTYPAHATEDHAAAAAAHRQAAETNRAAGKIQSAHAHEGHAAEHERLAAESKKFDAYEAKHSRK